METIAALELVVGFPKLAQVFPAAAGTLRIESDGRAIGFSLEAGTRVEAREAVTAPALLHQSRAPLVACSASSLDLEDEVDQGRMFTTWLDGDRVRPLALALPRARLETGDDDRVLAITPTAVHVLDRKNRCRRTVEVPAPLNLNDPVSGGVGGELDRQPLYVEPGFVVFVRSPALLVVALHDLERALVFDHVSWAIETHLVAREPELTAWAKRGSYNPLSIVTATGTLWVSVGPEPVGVRDRLWPPCGWATVELANGKTIAAHAVPPQHRVEHHEVEVRELFLADPPRFHWDPPAALPAPPPGTPGPRHEEALAYARRVELARRGRRGPMREVYEQLARADGEAITRWIHVELYEREELYEATAYAVPALVAILADPRTTHRLAIATALVRLAIVALGEHDGGIAVPAVIDAFRAMLPVLLSLRDASRALLRTCSLLVSAVGFADGEPAWFQAARGLPEFRQYGARYELYGEILEDNY